jgi:hypothetical protein
VDDLIPVPTLGWLYRITLLCGHQIFRTTVQAVWWCEKCGAEKWPRSFETVRGG